MAMRKKWSELGGRSRALVVVTGIVEVALLAAALVDIRRRPADRINGPKWMWTPVAFVSFVGPLAYFVFGRRRRGDR
jgi:hypothetical protein